LILFGLRSPIAVDYEVTAERAGTPFTKGVSVDGPVRILSDMDVYGLSDIDTLLPSAVIPCAFSPDRRAELADIARAHGFDIAKPLIDPNAILPPWLKIGIGSYVNAGVVIGGGCRFGEGVLVNRSASIGHHSVIEDWVSIGPAAVLSGNVRVGPGSMIGAGAIIQSDVRIGAEVKVSAGSVVRKAIPDGALVAGNPAKIVSMRAIPSSLGRQGQE
jgi:sugar O-acyltransferase (sialic acid O-acetyltransferase NeuD family)